MLSAHVKALRQEEALEEAHAKEAAEIPSEALSLPPARCQAEMRQEEAERAALETAQAEEEASKAPEKA